MNLDLLDESYQMVKSKFPFEDFVQGGLTAPIRRSNRVAQTYQFWVSTQTKMCRSCVYMSREVTGLGHKQPEGSQNRCGYDFFKKTGRLIEKWIFLISV
jgi:hypothetical protein